MSINFQKKDLSLNSLVEEEESEFGFLVATSGRT